MKVVIILIILLLSVGSMAQDSHGGHSHEAQTAIREGLEIPDNAISAFSDSEILNAVITSVQLSKITTIEQLTLKATSSKLYVFVNGENRNESYACNPLIASGDIECEPEFPNQSEVIFFVNIPLNYYHEHIADIHSADALIFPAYLAAGVVVYYSFKKILNKVTTGSALAKVSDHSHFFSSLHDLGHEADFYKENVNKLIRLLAKDSRIGSIANVPDSAVTLSLKKSADIFADDFFNVALALIKSAGSCNGHCSHHSGVSAKEAKKTFVDSLPKFAATTLRDLYRELILPVQELSKGAIDPLYRKQLLNFVQLSTTKMVSSRGLAPTIVTGTFIVVGQLFAETLESLIMPAGAHLFCQVGNILVMSVVGAGYTAAYCLKNMSELPNIGTVNKFKTVSDLTVSQWRTTIMKLSPDKMSERLAADQRLMLSLALLQQSIEKELRISLNLNRKTKAEAIAFAKRLGESEKMLRKISLLLEGAKYAPNEQITEMLNQWLSNLSTIQQELVPTQKKSLLSGGNRGILSKPNLAMKQLSTGSSELQCVDLLEKLLVHL